MQQKKIIIFIAILFIASSAWLFHSSNIILDPNAGKDWFAVYFVDPQSANFDFAIDNHSDNAVFHYEILDENIKINEGEIKITRGDSKTLNIDSEIKHSENGKITIRVSSAGENREIYKNF